MTAWKVLIPDRLRPPADVEQGLLGPDVTILLPTKTRAAEIPDEVWQEADAVIAWHEIQMTAEVITKLKRCRVIVRCGVGVDNVDLRAAARQGIPVVNIPDYGTNDVADHTMALLLMLARGIPAFNEQLRLSNEHWHWGAAGPLHRLKGATLGIIGLGRIGTAVAIRAKAFGLRVIFYDPYVTDGYDKAIGVERCETLDELLPQVDFISFHVPLNDETRGMADAAFFVRLKPGAIVVNTARGSIIQLDALETALRSRRIRAAGLDVLETEPPDPNHALIRAWRDREEWIAYRLVITPHAAFVCEEAYREMRSKAALNVRRALDGLPLRNVVN